MVLLHKLGMFKRLLALDAVLDLIGGMLFAWLFMGTLTGMAIAVLLLAFAPTAFAQGVAPSPPNENWTADSVSQPIQLSADQVTARLEAAPLQSFRPLVPKVFAECCRSPPFQTV